MPAHKNGEQKENKGLDGHCGVLYLASGLATTGMSVFVPLPRTDMSVCSSNIADLGRGWKERRGVTEPPCVRGGGEGGVFYFFLQLYFSPAPQLIAAQIDSDLLTECSIHRSPLARLGQPQHCPSSNTTLSSIPCNSMGPHPCLWSILICSLSQAGQLKLIWINSESLLCYCTCMTEVQISCFLCCRPQIPLHLPQPIFPLSTISSPCTVQYELLA